MPNSLQTSPQSSVLRHFSFRAKCAFAAMALMVLPILAWPLLAFLVVAGCAGGMHIGITCPPLDGIHLHSIPTDLLRFSVKGLVYSIPLGAVSLLVCRLASGRKQH